MMKGNTTCLLFHPITHIAGSIMRKTSDHLVEKYATKYLTSMPQNFEINENKVS